MEIAAPLSRKDEILKSATLLFDRKGYSAASMRDLAKEVGIEAGSLYSHFKSKESILQGICFKMASEYLDSIKPIIELELTNQEKLELAIQSHIRVLTKDPQASSVFQQDWKNLSEPLLTRFIELREEYEGCFMVIIKEGIQKGEFRIEDEKFVLLTILSSINWTSKWYRPDGKFSPDQIAKRLSKILIKGISTSNQ